MKRKIIYCKRVTTILLFVTAYLPIAAQENIPLHMGLLYPLSSNGIRALDYRNNISIHALSGLSAGESGLAVYGLAGIVKGDGSGLLASGLVTLIDGDLKGLQVSGLMNRSKSAEMGTQISGVLNLNNGPVIIQVAGIANQSKMVKSFQSAGVLNRAEVLEGAQIAGVTNIVKEVKGVQIAGVVNLAKQVNGSQISGLINKAETVKGIQLAGLINIADSSDYPIGIINLIKNGEKRVGLSTDENLSTFASFRSGGKKLYGIIGIGSNFQFSNLPYGLEAGLGIQLLNGENFRLDMEAVNLVVTDFRSTEYSKSGIRLLPALKLGNSIQIFAGPSLNYLNSKNLDGSDLGGLKFWESRGRKYYKSIDAGYILGIQFSL